MQAYLGIGPVGSRCVAVFVASATVTCRRWQPVGVNTIPQPTRKIRLWKKLWNRDEKTSAAELGDENSSGRRTPTESR